MAAEIYKTNNVMYDNFVGGKTWVWLYDIGIGFLSYPVEKIYDGSDEDFECS
ncbi:hypothetical protein R6Q59_001421, partial [Mikania micrantha]